MGLSQGRFIPEIPEEKAWRDPAVSNENQAMELEQQLHSGLVPLPSCGLGEVTRSLYASASSLMKGNFLRYKEADMYFLTILPVSCEG